MIIRQLLKMTQSAMGTFTKSLLAGVVPGAVQITENERHLINILEDLKIVYVKILSFKFNTPTDKDEDMTLTDAYKILMSTGEKIEYKSVPIPGLANYPYSNKCTCPKCTGIDPNYVCENN